jgi:hypothetical protein
MSTSVSFFGYPSQKPLWERSFGMGEKNCEIRAISVIVQGSGHQPRGLEFEHEQNEKCIVTEITTRHALFLARGCQPCILGNFLARSLQS